jgi:sigma54-dependent transcription regulator
MSCRWGRGRWRSSAADRVRVASQDAQKGAHHLRRPDEVEEVDLLEAVRHAKVEDDRHRLARDWREGRKRIVSSRRDAWRGEIIFPACCGRTDTLADAGRRVGTNNRRPELPGRLAAYVPGNVALGLVVVGAPVLEAVRLEVAVVGRVGRDVGEAGRGLLEGTALV